VVELLKWPKRIISKIFRGGLDKMAKDVYIYYSGPTDDTGRKLAEALNAKHGKVKPSVAKDMIVIGWGCKTDSSTNMGSHTVLNHPNNIRTNRNKFETLKILENAGVPVSNYVPAKDVLGALDNAKSPVNIPLIGRKKYHQGGKGFWACMCKGHIRTAIGQGAEYFQNYLDIKDEYRIHVFKGKVINMQKKTERTNMTEAFKEQHGARIADVAAKNKIKLDQKTTDYILENLGKRLEHPDQIIKSNTRGWKFSQVKTVKKELTEAAVNAVKAIGLDFGAVDCCLTDDGKPYIIEVNTGPGLQGTSFGAYVSAFKEEITLINKPAAKKVETAPLSKTKPAAMVAAVAATGGSVKQNLAAKAALMSEMIANADENEAAALQSVLKKMWG